MRTVKSQGSTLEISLIKHLKSKGFYFSVNVKKLLGKPDIVFFRKRIVIFIDSCFWHGCRFHCRLPHSNRKYWNNKIQNNVKRDKLVNKYYKSNNWTIIRIWEHQIKKNFDYVIDKIYNEVKKTKGA